MFRRLNIHQLCENNPLNLMITLHVSELVGVAHTHKTSSLSLKVNHMRTCNGSEVWSVLSVVDM